MSAVQNVNSLFRNTCTLDPDDPISVDAAQKILDEISQDLAKDIFLRQLMGKSEPLIWPILHNLWQVSVSAHTDERYETWIKSFIQSLAKFTRNLVAAVPNNQLNVFVCEPLIRQILFTYTSFHAINDSSSLIILLVQTISNTVTAYDDLLSRLWDIYMNLPEEQSIITRMLSSPDIRCIMSAFVLVLNCIHGSRERSLLLTTRPVGTRICIAILDRIVTLHNLEQSSDGGKTFEVGYSIFARLMDHGLLPDLYSELSVDGEIIMPHQTVLLKLLDSYLHTSPLTVECCQQLSPMVASTFFDLTEFAGHAIDRVISMEPSPLSAPPSLSSSVSTPGVPEKSDVVTAPPSTPVTPPDDRSPDDIYATASVRTRPLLGHPQMPVKDLDMLLPQICEALVLIAQCLITLALTSEDPEFEYPGRDNPKDFFNMAMIYEGHGLVEAIIGMLRRLDRFLPRIMFGKPVDLSSLPLPTGAQHTQYPVVNTRTSREEQYNEEGEGPAKQGFAYLKRDLVRLLGILCAGDKTVQDRIRLAGGIPVVMNLCVVDERNPYLREHALFALRNLLEGNLENQAVVHGIQPVQPDHVTAPMTRT